MKNHEETFSSWQTDKNKLAWTSRWENSVNPNELSPGNFSCRQFLTWLVWPITNQQYLLSIWSIEILVKICGATRICIQFMSHNPQEKRPPTRIWCSFLSRHHQEQPPTRFHIHFLSPNRQWQNIGISYLVFASASILFQKRHNSNTLHCRLFHKFNNYHIIL